MRKIKFRAQSKTSKESADCACAGSWHDVIKMIGSIIVTYSQQLGVSKKEIFTALAVALDGKVKK